MENKAAKSEQIAALPSGGRMILIMGLVGLIASFLLVATYVVTQPYIEANLAAYLEEAIGIVLPGTTAKTTLIVEASGLRVETDATERGDRIYVGYDSTGTFTGVAIPAQGQGYQDIISLIYGYSPDCGCIIGMKVLESRETPGLGDKIEKDDTFLANFEQLDVRWDEASQTLSGILELIKGGNRSSAWEIDGISGATISSRAITDILNASNARIIPLIEQNRELFSPKSNE